MFWLAVFAACEITAAFNGNVGKGANLQEACKNSGSECGSITVILAQGGTITKEGNWPVTSAFPALDSFEMTSECFVEDNVLPQNAFTESDKLKNVKLMNVQTGKEGALAGLTALEVFEAPGLEVIEDGVFKGIKSLTTFTAKTVKKVGAGAFSESGLVRFVNTALEDLGDEAFANCQNFSEFNIQTGSVKIGTDAFKGCSALRSVTLLTNTDMSGTPDIFKDFPLLNFQFASSINKLNLNPDPNCLGYVRKVGDWCPSGDYVMQPYVTEVDAQTFAGCKDMRSVKISESVSVISEGAFKNCTSLEEIAIPKNVVIVGDNLFLGCSKLSTVTFEGRITSLGANVFTDCDSLKLVSIPVTLRISGSAVSPSTRVRVEHIDGIVTDVDELTVLPMITEIGSNSYSGCSLTSVIMNGAHFTIEDGAFSNCPNLRKVWIGEGCSSIGKNVFSGSSSISAISLLTNADLSQNADLLKDLPLLNFQFASSINKLNLNPDPNCLGYVRKVGDWCPSGDYVMQPYVTEVDAQTFAGCKDMRSVKISESVSVISEGAFKNCTSLEEIAIPKNVVILGDNMFMGCTALQTISVMGPVISLGANVFADCSSLTKVMVPPTLRLTSSTVRQEAEVCIQRVEGLHPDLSNLTVLPIATRIGEGAFANTTTLLSVTIPNSVRVIEADAFFQCSKLSNVTFVEDAVVKSLDSRSLGGLAFREVTLPRSVEAVGNGVMAESKSLETIYVYKEFPLDKFRDALTEGTNAVVKVIEEKKTVSPAIIASAVVGALALLVIIIFIIYIARKRKTRDIDAQVSVKSLLASVDD